MVLQLSHTPATRCLFALAEGAAAALGPAARDFAPAFRFAVIEGRGGGDRAGGTGRHRKCRALAFQRACIMPIEPRLVGASDGLLAARWDSWIKLLDGKGISDHLIFI